MKRTLVVSAALLALGAPPLPAQAPGPPREELVAVDPIRCWWRTDKGAIHIGETFRLTLTCAVLENDAVQVVPDETRLGSSVVSLAPFEVVDGGHPEDLRSGERRFFQYAYDVRIINRDVIGTDVPLPVLQVNYRVNSRIGGNAALQGREFSYLLPAQHVRVVSMVPQDAADIRDTPNRSESSFSEVESLSFRADLFRTVGIILMALGGLMAVAAVVRLLLRARTRIPVHERTLSEPAILRVAARELDTAAREGESAGWTEAAADRALSASRVAAAIALGRAVNQRVDARAPDEAAASEGRLVIRRRGKPFVLSSAVTPGDVGRALSALPAGADRREILDDLQRAMTAFTTLLYGRQQAKSADLTALNSAASSAAAAIRRLAAHHRAPAQIYRRWTARAAQREARA